MKRHGVQGTWISAQGFHQPRHMPALVEEVPWEPIQQVMEHTQDEKHPTDTCRNLTLPHLLIWEVLSTSTFSAKSDSEITKI